MRTCYRIVSIVGLVLCIGTFFTIKAEAASFGDITPVVRAILFYSPTCGHCHKVINEDLPPLIEEYGDQLQIIGINVTTEDGQALYQSFIQHWEIPDERLGVPTMVVGDLYLVGSGEIPEKFPSIVEDGIMHQGIDWPIIPGLEEIIEQAEDEQGAQTTEVTRDDPANSPTPHKNSTLTPEEPNETATQTKASESSMYIDISTQVSPTDRFRQDLFANTIAIFVLVGMIITIVWVFIRILGNNPSNGVDWSWTIPALTILGLFVAGYLSFVEITESEAVCGPIGDCNSVQQSPYAILFGILPVGILGLIGYINILIGWLLYKFGPISWRNTSLLTVWGMALFGVLFSIYLTYLEPFVIGATCAWCISSAIIITLILIAATEPVRWIWTDEDDGDGISDDSKPETT